MRVRDKILCGVIGAGWWATYAHIPSLQQHPRAELIAIQNDDPGQAASIVRDFRIPHACTDIESLLALDGLDAVIVSSTPHLHYRDAMAALTAGKHVLIEKPMTLTLAQAKELEAAARHQGLQFLISCPWHHTAHGLEARRLIRAGALGAIRMVSVLMTNPISDLLRGNGTEPTHGTPYMRPRAGTYSDPRISGGGQIFAQVCHAAAYLTFLTGSEATHVFARFQNDGAKVDIYDSLSLRMDDGSIVSLASTGATSLERKDFEVRVFGTEGMLFIDLWNGKLTYAPMRGAQRTYPDLSADAIYPHSSPAHNLIDSIYDPQSNQSPAELGVAAMKVLEAACISAHSGEDVVVAELAGDTA
jgi:predicted dehydrogenase